MDMENTVDIDTITTTSNYLPYICIEERGSEKVVVLKDGNDSTVLPAGWCIKHLAAKTLARQLVGKQYTNRTYKTSPEWTTIEQAAIDGRDKWQVGYVHLLLISYNQQYKLVTFETFGPGETYWLPVLKAAKVKGKMVAVKIANHAVNNVLSKNKYAYLAAYKFSQWAVLDIPTEVQAQMQQILDTSKTTIDSFIKR